MSNFEPDDAAQLDGKNNFAEAYIEDNDVAENVEIVAADDGFQLDNELPSTSQGGVAIKYAGEDWLDPLVPTRTDIVAANNRADVSAKLRAHMDAGSVIFFMPSDVEECNEYHDGQAVYGLRLYGVTMDGAKADVTVTGINVFFDIRVPDRLPCGTALNASPQDWEPGRVAQFEAHVHDILGEAGVAATRVVTVDALPGRGYHEATKQYKRVFTATVQQRKKAIAAVRAAGLDTASDDRSSYYRKAAREYGFPLSDWAVLRNYEYVAGPTNKSPLCTHIFRVPVADYRPLVDALGTKECRLAGEATKSKNSLLAKDRTLVVAWDIETHCGRGTGELPAAEFAEDNAFMISVTAHWKDDPKPLAQICIVDVASAPCREWTTIVCGTPENVIRAFALVWRALAPDINIGFNDSGYDWPFIVEKARRYNILAWMMDMMSASVRARRTDESVLRWHYQRDRSIKISADDTFKSSFLKIPGCVPIDVRVCYKKLYPKSEVPKGSSLKFYLGLVGLPGKADMPIKRMWNYYEAALDTDGEPDATSAEHMRHVAHYCVIDALRCQQLMVRRNVVNEYRSVSSIAYVSLYDAHYYAGGMKVCNLLAAYAWRRNMLVSMIPLERNESGKYPGAHVFQPEKGISPDPDRLEKIETAAAKFRAAAAVELASDADAARKLAAAELVLHDAFAAFAGDRPVTGLDFASLYPSLIMAYNLSPEKILLTNEEADYWRQRGRTLYPIEFQYNSRAVRGWAVRHENVEADIGLYPSVLIDLFAKRADAKRVLNVHGAVKELIESVKSRAAKDSIPVAAALLRVRTDASAEIAGIASARREPRISPGSTLDEEIADMERRSKNAQATVAGVERIVALAGEGDVAVTIAAEFSRASFDWTCANTTQAALKVYMNTFYGEAGNSISPFFMLPLAGGVTSAGQFNIKLVANFVTSKGFRIKYGDTDSLYLVCPDKYFVECDATYAAGRMSREEWWAAMVRITMRVMNAARDDVNAHLRANNGTNYLKMAYEEVLYPVVFTGKKKYFGISHEHVVNFRPTQLFVKGIDVVKQGQPDLARAIGFRTMWACVALDNTRTVRRIVEDVLRDAVVNSSQWKFDDFIKSDAWKPNKNNIPVQRFISRMRARIAIESAENAARIAAGEPARASLYEMPDAGERFRYVIVQTGAAFDLRGRKSAMKKGDRMEFADVAHALNREIDVAYYMVSYVIGLCARFINGDAEFQPPPNERLTDTNIDKMSQAAAKKVLDIFIKGLSGLDSGTLRKRGYAYRRAFASAATTARDALVEQIGASAADVLHGDWLDFELFGDEDDEDGPVNGATKTIDALWTSAGALAQSVCDDGGNAWCVEVGNNLDIATNLFSASRDIRARRRELAFATTHHASSLDRMEAALRAEMIAALPAVSDIATRYEADLERLVSNHRLDEHTAHPEIGAPVPGAGSPVNAIVIMGVTASDRAALLEFRGIWFNAVGLQLTKQRAAMYALYIVRLKNRRMGAVVAPSRAERDRAIATAAAKLRTSASER